MSRKTNIADYSGDGTAENLLSWAFERFHPRIAVACSFQSTVLVHMALEIRRDAKIFAIDTGRLTEETYQCAADVERRFGIKIEWYFPRHDLVEGLLREKGAFSFKESIEARKECCAIRKIEPLNRALTGLDAWVTGVRREASITRSNVGQIELDRMHGDIIKINPLAHWSTDEVRDYVKKYRLPYNSMWQQGYTSIGCECCTRPVQPGDDPRSGRWWWESSDHKECGLHVRDWSI